MRNWQSGTGVLGTAVGDVSFLGTGLNDLTAQGTYTGTIWREYHVWIASVGATDTFGWAVRTEPEGTPVIMGGAPTGIAITGAAQTLEHGVTITFGATTGHTLITDSGYWHFTVGGSPIRLLSSVTTAKTADSYTGTDEDDFNRADTVVAAEGLGDGWTSPSWELYEGGAAPVAWDKPLKVKDNRAINVNDGDRAVAVRDTFGQPEISDSYAYAVQFDIGRKNSGDHEYHVYLQLNDLDPNMGNEGIDVTFLVTKIGSAYVLTGDVEGRYGVDSTDITDFGDLSNSLLNATGAWASGTAYHQFDTATYGGTTYQCLVNHTATTALRPDKSAASTYWVASQGVVLSESVNSVSLSMTANTLTITVSVNGIASTVFGPVDCTMSPALQGRTVGIGMKHKNWWLDNWRVTGLLVQGTPTTRKTTLIAGSNGHIYYESAPGTMTLITDDAAVIASEYPVMAEELNSKLYIADYAEPRVTGSDGVALIPTDQGTWSGATTYAQGDVVDKSAATHYIALQASTNKDPATETDYWLNIGTSALTHAFLASTTAADWTSHSIVAATDVVVIDPDNDTTGPVADAYQIGTIAAGYLKLAKTTVRQGGCSFRVEKAPLVLDASTDPPTVSIWTATSGYGTVPTGCQLICRYKGALMLARSATDLSNWFICRTGNALDWDFTQTDAQAAAYYLGGTVGKPGDAITALLPWKDDYIIFGCTNSLYVMRGHPRFGGKMDAISYEAGMLTGMARCPGPSGAFYWLGPGGFYGLQSIEGDMHPKNLSQNTVPRDLAGINPENYLVFLSYDTERYGVWITMTHKSGGASRSWFWDERTGAFWPDRYPSAKDPAIAYRYVADSMDRTALIFGCMDGRLRRFDEAAKDDDGDAIDSYCVFAPQALGEREGHEGILTELRADLSENTDRVDWQLRSGKTFEAAVKANAMFSGTWKGGGMEAVMHKRIRGKAICLRLANANAGQAWEVENITGTVIDGGKARP